jgi:alcohol dehydrogenase (NADP+)
MLNAKAYSAASAKSPLHSTRITRRDPTEHDVQIDVLFCGICHSDLHQVRDEWSDVMPTVYPCVPGHEIVGRVSKVGSAVSKFKPDDLAAVGCMVDSDGTELNEAAYLLGYEDSNSFVRAFRTWEGIPPARWREEQRARAAS